MPAIFLLSVFFFKDFIHLFLERGEGREKGREKNIIGYSMHPSWRPGPQPKNVPWPAIVLATFCFAGQHLTNWATLVGAIVSF